MITIYQINPDLDTNNVIFMPYDFAYSDGKTFNFSPYDIVWEEEGRYWENLDEIYEEFNLNRPENFKGHSLSVSDVVQVNNEPNIGDGYYYCDSLGWKKLDYGTIK